MFFDEEVVKILVKTNSRYKRWMKWLKLYPRGKELKTLVEKQRRRNLCALVRWNGGVGGRWHPESTDQLLNQHRIPVIHKRRYGRSYNVKVGKIPESKESG